MIAALVGKDLKLFFRNQFFTVVTLLGMISFIGVYYLIPAMPDDQIPIAIYFSSDVESTEREFLIRSIEAEEMTSEAILIESVENGGYQAGVVLTAGMIDAINRGGNITIPIYTAPGTSRELAQALEGVFTVGFNNLKPDLGTNKINVDDDVTILGPDLLGIGEPIALRDRMLPLLILTLLSIELMGLANLISEEVESKTANALLVTPLSSSKFFFSKAVMGIGLAVIETLLLITATGKIATSPGIVFAALLAGSLMVTGVAFLIASIAKDLMSVLSWSTLFLLVLSLPGISIMFPTMTGGWMRAIPTFYLVDILNKTLNYGFGWNEAAAGLGILGFSGLMMYLAGSLILERRFQ